MQNEAMSLPTISIEVMILSCIIGVVKVLSNIEYIFSKLGNV